MASTTHSPQHPFFTHLAALLSLYELGPSLPTPLPKYDGPTDWQIESIHRSLACVCSRLSLRCHKLAQLTYCPQLPPVFIQWYTDTFGEPPTAVVLKFLKSELMQKIWTLLLDDDFLDAWRHGTLINCGDGILRRIFPRVFTYSADYPEK